MAEGQENSSEERTEAATPFRREEFRRQGSVALSKELSSVVLMAGVGATLYLAMGQLFVQFKLLCEKFLTVSSDQSFGKAELLSLIPELVYSWASIIAPIFGAAFVLAIVVCVAQVGFFVTWDPLSPNFDRLNPVKGFQRIFSAKGSAEGIKAVLKVIVVMSIAYSFFKAQLAAGPAFFGGDTAEIVARMLGAISNLFFYCVSGLAVIAVGDYAFQKWQLEKKMRMTKTEARDEFKLREGDPHMKNRIKSTQRRLSNQRMMEAVPKADVIVTNPTHFAVAIEYDAEGMAAPKVTAKGMDKMAFKIREVAKFYNIPIVENKPLARTLYKQIEIGQYVPKDLYKAVAEVLAYVYRLRDNFRPQGI